MYAGKAEKSLRGRDVSTHFAAGRDSAAKTGSLTVRRSFAALLRGELDLQPVPREAKPPYRLSMFSLAEEGDARLSRWMHDHLTLSTWPSPGLIKADLARVETALITRLDPRMNIAIAPTSRAWQQALRADLARPAGSATT